MSEKICLNVPRLGGRQDFEIISQEEYQKTKYYYVCSTWNEDGCWDICAYDIVRNNENMEYYAVICD